MCNVLCVSGASGVRYSIVPVICYTITTFMHSNSYYRNKTVVPQTVNASGTWLSYTLSDNLNPLYLIHPCV